MDYSLREYIESVLTPPLAATASEIIDELEKLSYEEYYNDFRYIMDVTETPTQEELILILTSHVYKVLSMVGIHINQGEDVVYEPKFHELAILLGAVNNLDKVDVTVAQDIVTYSETIDDSVEYLSEVLAKITPLRATTIYKYIDSVDESMVKNLVNIAKRIISEFMIGEELNVDAIHDDRVAKVIAKLLGYLRDQHPMKRLKISAFMTNGLDVDMSANMVLPLIDYSELNIVNPVSFAVDIVAMLLIVKETRYSIYEGYLNYIEKEIEDTFKRDAVTKVVKNLALQLEAEILKHDIYGEFKKQ